MSNILFLGIDGVLNCRRTAVAYDGYPFVLPRDMGKFDLVAIALIQRFCEAYKYEVVVSSTWRKRYTSGQLAMYLGLPIISRTRNDLSDEIRGDQIADWLVSHPEVQQYLILDAGSDFHADQMDRLVQTCAIEGFQYSTYELMESKHL